VVKLIHGRKIIRVKPIGIFPRLTKRGENPLFEGALSVVLCNMRFDTHDDYPPPSVSTNLSYRHRFQAERRVAHTGLSASEVSRLLLDQFPIVQADGPYSFPSDAGVRPLRTKLTICRLNSGVYRVVLLAILNTSKSNDEVSTKPGQVQSNFGR
jgi:hypothetical protein